jgi:DNA-binding MarR family transcriptional regulator
MAFHSVLPSDVVILVITPGARCNATRHDCKAQHGMGHCPPRNACLRERLFAYNLEREHKCMGRGKCVISEKDLDILERLYHDELHYQLHSLAEALNSKPDIIFDNLERLERYGLVVSKVNSESSPAGYSTKTYYSITNDGKQVCAILIKNRIFDEHLDI